MSMNAARWREALRVLVEDGQAAGLSPIGRTPGTPHASALLVAHARPAMEFVYEQTRDSDSLVLLSDAQGLLLDTLGDAGFVNRAERVALRAGANWHEQWRGTNAIDISSDHRQFHRHTLGLARSAARMVEHRLFETRHRDSLRLRLHKHREAARRLGISRTTLYRRLRLTRTD